ncbi:MAG: hypothetical protein MZV65_29055 [Chromatiales bacterium]|nr:hypothetical protein [Chromatiales bacterium]
MTIAARRAGPDDQLYIWFNETIAVPGNIAIGDFILPGFNSTGLSLTTDVQGASQRVTISGFTNTNYPTQGSRVRLADGSGLDRLDQRRHRPRFAAEQPAAPWVLVEDESRPYTAADERERRAHLRPLERGRRGSTRSSWPGPRPARTTPTSTSSSSPRKTRTTSTRPGWTRSWAARSRSATSIRARSTV